MNGKIKIALVFPNLPNRSSASVWLNRELGSLVFGFQILGNKVTVILTENSSLTTDVAIPDDIFVVTADSKALVQKAFWKSHNFDIVLIVTWMVNAVEIVKTTSSLGIFTISKGDTDGMICPRVYPIPNLIRRYYDQESWVGKLKALWYWFKRYAYLYEVESRSYLANLNNAHATIVETAIAKEKLSSILCRHQASHLLRKIYVVPNPVFPDFLAPFYLLKKKEKIVAVGRWSDPQKDIKLLSRSLSLLLKDNPFYEIAIFGDGGDKWFKPLTRQHSRLFYFGNVSRKTIVEQLATSRIILFTSRWEGSPNAANEALVMGCTVIGTDIPAFQDIIQQGPFGAVAHCRSPHCFVKTIKNEMLAWDQGHRDPYKIAKHWQDKVSPVSVAKQVIDIFNKNKV